MSAVAYALTSEDGSAVQLHGRRENASRLGVQSGVEAPVLEVKRRRAASGASSRAVPTGINGAVNGFQDGAIAAHEWARLGTTRSPARSGGVDAAERPGRHSPESFRKQNPSAAVQGDAHPMATPPRSSSIAHAPSQNGAAPPGRSGPSTAVPASPPRPVLRLPPESADRPRAQQSNTASLHLPPAIPAQDLPILPHLGRDRNMPPSDSLASSLSAATSNSSHLPQRQSLEPPHAADLSPYPSSSVSFNSYTDPDGVAALVQRLYARLDEKGVHGDGWDEGKERSRDGIILREVADAGGVPDGEPLVEPKGEDEEAKADHILRRVDRYGFFSNSHPAALSSQHHNIFTLSAGPLEQIPSIPPKKRSAKAVPPSAPPVRPTTRNLSNRHSTISLLPSTAISPETVALETKRVGKWGDMLVVAQRDPGGNAQDWIVSADWWSGRAPGGGGGQSGKYRRLQRRVFKGIPDRWRRAVWGLMLERMASEVEGQTHRTPPPSLEQLRREYDELVAAPYVQDVQIDLDVPRTISGHVMFHTRYGQGQRALFHVLHAFGLRCESIGGYCQGMGSLAATLLCYFEPERAYAAMCRLFDQYRLAHIFAPGFPGLHEAWHVQQKLVELLMPEVYAAFENHGVHPSSYSSKWYLTLYTNSFPFATQLRLWDALLLEGVDVLVIIAVAIIWHFRHQFVAPTASFESILTTLGGYFFVDSDDALLRWVRKTLRLKGLREKMHAWRDQYRRENGMSAGVA